MINMSKNIKWMKNLALEIEKLPIPVADVVERVLSQMV